MTITFYHCSAENNKVDKTNDLDQSSKITLEGTLRDECSIMKPVILIEYTALSTFTFNYCLIPYFSRYYFVKNITCVRNGLYRIELAVDVLMSYKTQILDQTAIISRQQNKYNLYLPDDSFKVYTKPQVKVAEFSNGFNVNPTFVLAIAGSN